MLHNASYIYSIDFIILLYLMPDDFTRFYAIRYEMDRKMFNVAPYT